MNLQMFLRRLILNSSTKFTSFSSKTVMAPFAKTKLSNIRHPLVCNFCFNFPVYQSSICISSVISISPKPPLRNYSKQMNSLKYVSGNIMIYVIIFFGFGDLPENLVLEELSGGFSFGTGRLIWFSFFR